MPRGAGQDERPPSGLAATEPVGAEELRSQENLAPEFGASAPAEIDGVDAAAFPGSHPRRDLSSSDVAPHPAADELRGATFVSAEYQSAASVSLENSIEQGAGIRNASNGQTPFDGSTPVEVQGAQPVIGAVPEAGRIFQNDDLAQEYRTQVPSDAGSVGRLDEEDKGKGDPWMKGRDPWSPPRQTGNMSGEGDQWAQHDRSYRSNWNSRLTEEEIAAGGHSHARPRKSQRTQRHSHEGYWQRYAGSGNAWEHQDWSAYRNHLAVPKSRARGAVSNGGD